jgi:hypothetical protein
MNKPEVSNMYQDNVVNILSESSYWRRRSEESPEILKMAGL